EYNKFKAYCRSHICSIFRIDKQANTKFLFFYPDWQSSLFAGTVCRRQYSVHDSSARRSTVVASFKCDVSAAIYAVYQLGTVMFCSTGGIIPSGLSAYGD